ncbi:uncharacterized protein LOC114362701 isoform X2 [Ostrinia furnacalis]|uniref:uncharacterized protein LOC114362701 isoform X2 n=1 Tax=Ostrinia furnacalis TaxID=93504 RepID=UPI00103D9C93|nr:uncharacterized protein LOC114362701 isoform X2 [Ostrinia furnacalis]
MVRNTSYEVWVHKESNGNKEPTLQIFSLQPRRGTSIGFKMSNAEELFPSEDEAPVQPEPEKRKRKSSKSASTSKKSKAEHAHRVTAAELFGSDSEDDDVTPPAPSPGKLLSYISRRLANGISRQAHPSKPGSHYIELKVYKCNDIEKVSPVNRWRQAIITVKNRTDDNSEAWTHLSNYIIATRKEFRSCPPTFVSNYY